MISRRDIFKSLAALPFLGFLSSKSEAKSNWLDGVDNSDSEKFKLSRDQVSFGEIIRNDPRYLPGHAWIWIKTPSGEIKAGVIELKNFCKIHCVASEDCEDLYFRDIISVESTYEPEIAHTI